jgi:hypothetical protein
MVLLKNKSPYVLNIKKITNNNNSKIIKNNDFKFYNEMSPLSGSELDYNPDKYNKNLSIKDTHNCYSYALGKIVKGLKSKAQPGYASGHDYIKLSDYSCEEFSNRLKKDNPMSYLESFDKSCVAGFYKIFLALDVGNDYHWWRQDKDGYWSHKPGAGNVTNLDGEGKKIKNPLLSQRNFGRRNYYKPCFFACIQSDLTRALNNIYI